MEITYDLVNNSDEFNVYVSSNNDLWGFFFYVCKYCEDRD